MISTDKLHVLAQHEIHLNPGEEIKWTGQPKKLPFLQNSFKPLFYWLAIFTGLYVLSKIPSFCKHLPFSISSFLWIIGLATCMQCYKTIKNFRGYNKIVYIITCSRVIVARKLSFQQVIYIPGADIVDVQVSQSKADEIYDTATITIDSGKTVITSDGTINIHDYFYSVAERETALQLLETFITANKKSPKTN